MSAAATARRRKKRPASCSSLRKRARRIKNARKRKRALANLPKRCKPAKSTPPKLPKPSGGTQPSVKPGPVPAGVPAAAAVPVAIEAPKPIDPTEVYTGEFGVRQAERLLWRAGFGPRPGQAQALADMGLEAAVLSLTRPTGTAPMDGAAPTVDGDALDPYGSWGHDHLWWLDRMVRSGQGLVERMTLVFHDWFATSNDGVGNAKLMLQQNNLFRRYGLGGFDELLTAVTADPAMLIWLSGIDNRKGAINENYGRELMELFTLGADRGAYTEADVRDIARALTGWRVDWVDGSGWKDTSYFDSRRFDGTAKTVFGQTGAFGTADALRLVLEHPLHASFFVTKLWSYFIPSPPSDATRTRLEGLYTSSGRQIRPVLEAILTAPELYAGDRMVKPPVVYTAGLMRARGKTITSRGWEWMGSLAGQKLFYPPDVSGWDDDRWLDTSTVAGRWWLANEALIGGSLQGPAWDSYPNESADTALAGALAFWGSPWLTAETRTALRDWAGGVLPVGARAYQRAQRQTALRMLVAMSPDFQTS